jgi:soluble lytic murein transglycosylase-like protein
MRYHPTAFATIADALDPVANARYAARFLHELRDRFGDWERAAGAYHSTTSLLEEDYRGRVMAQWKAAPVTEQGLQRWQVISISASMQLVAGPGAMPRIITLGN